MSTHNPAKKPRKLWGHRMEPDTLIGSRVEGFLGFRVAHPSAQRRGEGGGKII